MDFNSVGEIFEHIDGTRASLLRAVEGLSDGEQGFRPAPDRWSVAQLCEHLSIVEGNIVALLGKLLGKGEESGALRAEGAAFAPVSIEEFIPITQGVKVVAPERLNPADSTPLADTLARLRDSRAALHSLRPRIERADGQALSFPHPAWGPLNLYQWLLFIGAHESRHLGQIEALKEQMNAGRETID